MTFCAVLNQGFLTPILYEGLMDVRDLKTHQQIEFFLLHNLIVNNLKILKRTKRLTPIVGNTPKQREAAISRLFRSFLISVFPKPKFVVKKRMRFEEFSIIIAQSISRAVRTAIQADVTEKDFLDVSGDPAVLTIRIGRGDLFYRPSFKEFGIGKHCAAVNAVLSWKKRFDTALTTETVEIVTTNVPNRAQEELDALFVVARREGRI